MIIDETAIRGTNGDQDFAPAPGGEPNMLAHAAALVLRDRNHPSVIRWSQCNEPELDSTNSPHLSAGPVSGDRWPPMTRARSAATAGSAGSKRTQTFAQITADNFAAYGHYPGGLGVYTEQVAPSTTRPFGVGEMIWPADVTAAGIGVVRHRDDGDARAETPPRSGPYTLLSGWASFVPGVTTRRWCWSRPIPQGVVNHPLFGEDNLPDPWSNPIITRIQRGMNPVLVADTAFWMANRMSNANGDWPIAVETVALRARSSRASSSSSTTPSPAPPSTSSGRCTARPPDGAIASQGDMPVDVPLGGHATLPITVTMPSTGTRAYLVLRSRKDGREIFIEDAEWFQLQ